MTNSLKKMMKIEINVEVMPTMGGLVTYQTKPCPYGQHGYLKGEVATVGSTYCKMCPCHGGIQRDDTPTDYVICNHD